MTNKIRIFIFLILHFHSLLLQFYLVNIKFTNKFIMSQPHQHGPNCKHGSGGHQGHSHGQAGHGAHGGPRPFDVPPKQYFQKLSEMKKTHPQFYWTQIISGKPFDKFCEQKGLDFVRSISAQMVVMIVAQAEMMLTCEWLPLYIRPFVSGLFFPLLFLIFFNLNVIFGVQIPDFTSVHLFALLSLGFYFLVGVRQAGAMNTIQNQKASQVAIKQRPYLQTPNASCQPCKILKSFRAFHCPVCKVCISKFTRHSLAFGVCIGSCNQILAWLFFTSLTITQTLTLHTFFLNTSYGIITNIMFYCLNLYIIWISLRESFTLLVINFYFGVTEYQIRSWMMSQYLMKIPERQFVNSLTKGFVNNVVQSCYALFGIEAYQSQNKTNHHSISMQEQIPMAGRSSEFQKLDSSKTYLINWNKAFYYLTPQIPNHPCRQKIIQIMVREQPKMIQMFRMQKKFREQILKQNQGQSLSQMQMQQKISQKMQQHMMKSNPQMMQPNPQQQKAMQLQMLNHLYNQLHQTDPQSSQKVQQIINKLNENQLNPMEVGMSIKQLQQDIMKKKMETVLRQRQQMEKLKEQDEEEQLKKRQVPDQDL